MWTASVLEKIKDNDKIRIKIGFTDGFENVSHEYTADFESADLEWLKRQVAIKLRALNSIYSLANSLPSGVIDTTPAPISPPPPDTAQQIWLKKYRRLQQAAQLISLKVKAATDADVVALQDEVKTTFLPSYIDSI